MKKLLPLLLALLLLAGCAQTYDGPTEEKPMLTEYTITHYYVYSDWDQVHYTDRTLYAYDIYGNRVRSMEYRDDELQSVTSFRYDDRGNEVSRTEWDRSGWIPKFSSRTRRTYDGQDRVLSYESYNLWGRMESGSYYSYDDRQGIRTYRDETGEVLQTTWYDENGCDIRQVAGEYETVYQYDDQGNPTGWISYKNGQLYDRYEARYDEKGRQIWGGRYEADGTLTSQTEYVFDDEAHTMTLQYPDGRVRYEYYNADGRPVLIEDYNSEGKLSFVQRYTYQNILVPVKGDDAP